MVENIVACNELSLSWQLRILSTQNLWIKSQGPIVQSFEIAQKYLWAQGKPIQLSACPFRTELEKAAERLFPQNLISPSRKIVDLYQPTLPYHLYEDNLDSN